MTGFDGVRGSVYQVLSSDGRSPCGTAFRVLPAGFLLTCHHVVAGLGQILVRANDGNDAVSATYVEQWSDPVADIAVLHVPVAGEAVQVERMPGVGRAYGYGFRPRTVGMERQGHTFSGSYGPGQFLEVAVSGELIQRLGQVPESQRQPWNVLPERFRAGNVRNFSVDGGLEQGISGGPVYDPDLRKVVGLFRAVEEAGQAYVLPIDDVLTRWPELEQQNALEVPDEPLDALARDFRVQPVKMGRPVTPVLRNALEPSFPRVTAFGGRGDELGELDRFVVEGTASHLLVTGEAGFGKTTLLAEWISRAGTGDAGVKVGYHFISRRVDHGTDQSLCFENLCEQLMAHQRVGGDLPQGDQRLRSLYRGLLQLEPPPGERIVIVIDGLDEALGSWTPGSDMFPAKLPSGVRTIFSARSMADTDWRERFRLDDQSCEILRLSRLTETGVREIVERTAAIDASQRDLVGQRVWDLSLGDPYYVQDLLDELIRSGGTIEALAEFPIGHSNYLRDWWSSAAVDDAAFVDLMGILAVAYAPLTRAVLVAISTEDAVRDVNFSRLISLAARHVTGEETLGYRLSSTRVRDFVRAQIGDDLRIYEDRLAEFCLRWKQAKLSAESRDYILAHGAEHLASAERYRDLIDLLEPDWLAAKWQRYGSFSSLIHDIDVTVALARGAEPPDTPRVAALGLARATSRSLAQSVPPQLISAFGRLGERDRMLELVRTAGQVPDTPQNSVDQQLAAARALASYEQPGGSAAAGEIEAMYLGALARVADFDQAQDQVSALEAIAQAVGQAPEDARAAVVDEAASTAPAGLRDASARAAGLGLLAGIAATLPRRDSTERMRDDARQAIGALSREPDRISATAFLIGVTAHLDGHAAALALATQAVRSPSALWRSAISPVAAAPILRRWAALNVTDPGAEEWLFDISDRCLAAVAQGQLGPDTDDRLTAAGALIGHAAACLLRGPQTQTGAGSLLERTFAASLGAGVSAVRSVLSDPARPRPATVMYWLTRVASEFSPSEQAYWYASLGQLEQMRHLLKQLIPGPPRGTAAIAALDGMEQLDDVNGQVGDAVDEILGYGQDQQDDLLPEALSRGAAILSRRAPDRARKLAERASAFMLAPPPSKDLAPLRALQVAALHAEGRIQEAATAAAHIQDYDIAASTIAWLIRHPIAEGATSTGHAQTGQQQLAQPHPPEPTGPEPGIAPYVYLLADMVPSRNFAVMQNAAALAEELKQPFPALSGQLTSAVAKSSDYETMAEILTKIADSPDIAARLGIGNLKVMLNMLQWTGPLEPVRAGRAAAALLAVGERLPAVDRMEVRALYAQAMQKINPQASQDMIDGLLTSATDPSSRDSLTAYVALARHSELLASRIGGNRAALRWLLDYATAWGTESEITLYPFFWLGYESLPSAEGVNDIIEEALHEMAGISVAEARERAVAHAMKVLADAGELQLARRAESLLGHDDNEVSSELFSAKNALDKRERILQLGDLSVFEQFFLDYDTGSLAEVMLYNHRVQHDTSLLDTWLNALTNDLLRADRQGLSTVGVYTLLYPVYLQGGADLVAEVVASVEDFDQRFTDTARLLRATATGLLIDRDG
jgi:hypothetical protein